jgi:flagellar biosynthesis/type III secretory pathway protein FliH
LTFEQWFDKQGLRDYLELDVEKSIRLTLLFKEVWEEAFELGENAACEGAYDDGYNAGYREGKDSPYGLKEEYDKGYADGYKEGLSFRMEDFV